MDVLELRIPPKQGQEFIPLICGIVSVHQKVSLALMQSNTRKREVVFARQLAMTLARKLTNCSLYTIGLMIGMKDHATVLHSSKTINNLSDVDANIRGTYNSLYFKAISKIPETKTQLCPYCGSKNIYMFALKSVNTGDIKISDSETDYVCKDCNETYFKPIIEE